MLSNQARSLDVEGREQEAENLLRSALPMCESGALLAACVFIFNNLATIESRTGRNREAEQHWLRAVCMADSDLIDEAIPRAGLLNNLGDLYNGQGRYREAKALFERALEICRPIRGCRYEGGILANLGAIEATQKDFHDARVHLNQALAIEGAKSEPDYDRLATVYESLAAVATGKRHYAEADDLFQRATKTYERTSRPNPHWVAEHCIRYGQMNFLWKRYSAAVEAYRRGLAMLGSPTGFPPATEIALLEHYSECLKRVDDFATAEQVAMRAMNPGSSSPLSRTRRLRLDDP